MLVRFGAPKTDGYLSTQAGAPLGREQVEVEGSVGEAVLDDGVVRECLEHA